MNDARATADTSDFAVYGSSYFAASMVRRAERPALNLDLDVDVCVIGGGLAGLTTAREVARRGWSVVLLEGRRIAWNASGRNTGFVLPGYGQTRADDHRARRPRTRENAVGAVAGGPRLCARDHRRDQHAWRRTDRRRLAHGLQDRPRRRDPGGSRFLRTAFGADVEMWPTPKVRAHLKTSHYFQAIHFRNAFHIHPLNYALGLARDAEAAGVRIFEETPALSIDPVGVRKRVVTPNARVRAAHVVLAGNVHLGELMPEVARTLVPVTTYVAATAPLGDRPRPRRSHSPAR